MLEHVAPRVGAWIETLVTCLVTVALVSRPAWARGLKLGCKISYRDRKESRPAWARGLKLNNRPIICRYNVAPRVGAWIETPDLMSAITASMSRPAWARGLKRLAQLLYHRESCRAPRGRVD